MKKYLSILIPVYCSKPHRLVGQLCQQANALSGLEDYEVVVVDDGSPDRATVEACWEIGNWPHCRFMALEANIGRSRIRNLLATLARFEWLLYLDCDMQIEHPDFLQRYMDCDEGMVIDGGYTLGPGTPANLRWLYETTAASQHTAAERQRRPYQDFHTSNFMVHSSVMASHPFDSRIDRYGYEDVLFGKQMREAGIHIVHIENPATFGTFEPNAQFVSKTEEGLQTLYLLRSELRGYSRLLTFVEGIHLAAVRWVLRLLFLLCRVPMRLNLCSKKPSLQVFRLYKLGYFLSIN